MPGQMGHPVAAPVQPVVMVLRHGRLVGEAMGTLLPARELEGVVRSAVDRAI
jgi:hypothetical protein